ncbi:hypothetical protein [Amycolatopsis sp. NPDC051102]|uniref:hypothetical protein n=1 Tax=Amycolatopsis sp. NPDC051102 TaxID=3155163 RepID=UPI00342896FB
MAQSSPTNSELVDAHKLVIRVNERRKQGKLIQREELDQAARQMVLQLPKFSYEPAELYQRGMTPAERLKKIGLATNVRPIEKCAHKTGMLSSKDSLIVQVVGTWLKDPNFAAVVLDRRYLWCGAAYRDNCYVLLVAG